MKIQTIIFAFVLFGLWALSAAAADYRFPQPEFTSGYRLPSPTEPLPTMRTQPTLALGLLLIAMLATAFVLYRLRSRNWLRVLVILSLGYFGFYHGGCICPVGSIQNMSLALFNNGAHIAFPVIGAFLLPLLVALFLGRIFCGAACPLGAIQELVILRPVKVPLLLDRCLKLFPFVYLGLAVLFSACNMRFIICEYDPFVGIFRFSAKFYMFVAGGVLLLLGTVIARPYCRYVCPYSVLLRLTAGLSGRKVSTTPDICVVCHLCRDACPVAAIQPPRPSRYAETKEKAVKRLQWLAAITPLLLIVGMLLGALLFVPFSRLHPEIRMFQELIDMQQKNVTLGERDVYNRDVTAAEAFLMTGGVPADLQERVFLAQKRLKRGSVLFGAYLACVVVGALAAATRRRTNDVYTVNVAECLCCARCYQWCPRGKRGQRE